MSADEYDGHEMLDEEDRPALAQTAHGQMGASNSVWLQESGAERGRALATIGNASLLPRAQMLRPELERRLRSYEDVLIDLRRVGADTRPESWRLRGGIYAALMLLACLLLAGGAYTGFSALKSGRMGVIAAIGFALNIAGLAHLAGGWGRSVAGGPSWLHRLVTALLAIAASCEIVTLIYFAGLGWAEAATAPLIAMAAGASIAAIASALRARADPDIARLLRREAEARRDYETVRRRVLVEIASARRAFEQEAASLEMTAGALRRSAAE